MVEEKRKNKRVKEDFSIICKMYKKSALQGNVSKISDISKSGLSFVADNNIDKNNIVEFTFRIPPDFKEKVSLFGRVVGSEKISSTKFKTRVAFINIDPKTSSALENIIEQARFLESIQ